MLTNCATEIKSFEGFAGVHATAVIPAGSVVVSLNGFIQSFATRYTIQVSATEHLAPQAGEECLWRYLNHACNPNCHIDTEHRLLLASKRIPKGGHVTFNYNTCEWDMAAPFECRCGWIH